MCRATKTSTITTALLVATVILTLWYSVVPIDPSHCMTSARNRQVCGENGDMAYGPDGTLGLDPTRTRPFRIPPFRRPIVAAFATSAAFEVAVLIYQTSSMTPLVSLGNFSRAPATARTIPIGVGLFGGDILVTGWYKNGPPNGALPWLQARTVATITRRGLIGAIVTFGMDDSDPGDNDFNDATMTLVW